MGAMTIRNLDPKAAEVLRRRARAEGRSMNDLVVEILCRAAADEERRRRMREQRPGAERLWEVDCPQLVASSDLAAQALGLAYALDQSVYDCLYLALAIEFEASLATADQRLARAARSRLERVELIS